MELFIRIKLDNEHLRKDHDVSVNGFWHTSPCTHKNTHKKTQHNIKADWPVKPIAMSGDVKAGLIHISNINTLFLWWHFTHSGVACLKTGTMYNIIYQCNSTNSASSKAQHMATSGHEKAFSSTFCFKQKWLFNTEEAHLDTFAQSQFNLHFQCHNKVKCTVYLWWNIFLSFRTLDQDMSSLGMMLIFSINMVLPPCWYQYWNQSSLHSTNRLSDLIKISFPFFCVNNKGQSLHLERAQHKIQSDLSVDLQKKKFKLVKNKTCFYMSAKTYIQSEM